MAQVRVSSNCTGITLTTSGALTPDANNLITCTALEATSLVSPYNDGPAGNPIISTNISTGAVIMQFPPVVTSITINGNTYTITAGITTTSVPAADATNFIRGISQRESTFELVTG